jgi:transcriptional regulator with XRE-family HTH domain
MPATFSDVLKQWRGARRMSQLDLAMVAGVSARHISFLETARASPSRQMVLQLCEVLGVPIQGQNQMLVAAGFSEIYTHRELNDVELSHARQAIEWTLQKHDPFPAIAFDKYWVIVLANRTATMLLTALELKVGDSLLHALSHSAVLRGAILNWDDVAKHLVTRLRTESAKLGHDAVLHDAAESIARQLPPTQRNFNQENSALLTTQYQLNGKVFSLFSMLAQFGSAEDIALADLKIELMFPADNATLEFLMSLKVEADPTQAG